MQFRESLRCLPIVATAAALAGLAIPVLLSSPSRGRVSDLVLVAAIGALAAGVLVRWSRSTEGLRALEALRHQPCRDAVTGLANRQVLREAIEQAIVQARRDQGTVALLLIDLDNFQTLNNSLGHRAGDLLLASAGERLARCLEDRDTVARTGSDEFGVLLVRDSAQEAGASVQGLQVAFDDVFAIDGVSVHVSFCAGLSLLLPEGQSGDAVDPDDLLRDTDLALQAARRAGPGALYQYTAELHRAAVERLRIASDLSEALASARLGLAYQPIIDLRSRRIVGAEALLRWPRPEGDVSPMQVIAVAEQTGLIHTLGGWILEEALAQVRRWLDQGAPPEFLVSVNVSARQLEDGDFTDIVRRALAANRLPGRRLAIEIVESDLMRDVDAITTQLARLRSLGVTISVDDFGTGYSSLAYLQRLPVDTLKIDRSFVAGSATNTRDRAIIDAIVAMSRALSLDVIAEGVETDEQEAVLLMSGCGLAQGFRLGRPMDAATLGRHLATEDGALAGAR